MPYNTREPLTVTLDWGDGTPVTRVFGGITERDLPFGPVNYALTVTARDPSGQEAVAQATVNLVDNPTIISRVQQNRLAGGAVDDDGRAVDEARVGAELGAVRKGERARHDAPFLRGPQGKQFLPLLFHQLSSQVLALLVQNSAPFRLHLHLE